MTRRDPFAALRPHELRVLYYAARGLTNREIGRLLGCSEATIKGARYHAYLRLDVRTGQCAILMLLRAAQRVQDAQEADDGLPAPRQHRAAVATAPRAPRDRAA